MLIWKIKTFLTSFLRYLNDTANLPGYSLGHVWPCQPAENFDLLYFILFIFSLQLTDLQLKTDTILYTNKNDYVLIKKHANSCQLPNKNFLKLKF